VLNTDTSQAIAGRIGLTVHSCWEFIWPFALPSF